jgi:quercetin dioxygenase-like cupin family protein
MPSKSGLKAPASPLAKVFQWNDLRLFKSEAQHQSCFRYSTQGVAHHKAGNLQSLSNKGILTMLKPALYRWSEVEVEQLNPLLTRQYVHGDQAMVSRLVLSKGCVVPTHSHHNEQISFILEGSLRFDFGDGDIRTVNAGEILVIPAHQPHSAVALEDTINFDTFAPPREDWINKEDSYLRK